MLFSHIKFHVVKYYASLWCKQIATIRYGLFTVYILPQKKVFTFVERVFKIEGARWKVGGASTQHWSRWKSLDFMIFIKRGCLRLFVLVLPFFRISKWGLVQIGPTQWCLWRTPHFSSTLDFEFLALTQLYSFFRCCLYDLFKSKCAGLYYCSHSWETKSPLSPETTPSVLKKSQQHWQRLISSSVSLSGLLLDICHRHLHFWSRIGISWTYNRLLCQFHLCPESPAPGSP